MNTFDRQKEQRVWQRVRGEEEQPRNDRADELPELIMRAWNGAATYLQLARQLPQKQAQVLQKLSREELAHASCLKGIYTLMTGERAVTRSTQPEKEPPEVALRKCYGRELRNLKEYEKRSADPDYGHVFSGMAQKEREHCQILLELLGSLEMK